MAATRRAHIKFLSKVGDRLLNGFGARAIAITSQWLRLGVLSFALLAIFPALSALISLYGLTTDPSTIEQQFSMLAWLLPAQAHDIVIQQIHRLAAASNGMLGSSLILSLLVALWSTNSALKP
jgi:virulence factor BrkB